MDVRILSDIKLFHGDCLNIMKSLDDSSINLTVTSPPYDNLRTYKGNIDQWNFDKFKGIAVELYRITKDGGMVVWIVNDATIKGNETGSSFKQALFFKECGFNLHDTMIWIKDGGGAVGSNKCYTQNFEYMFVLSKGTPKTINLIHDKINLSFGVDRSGVGRRKPDGTKKIETRSEPKEFSRRNNWWYVVPQKQDASDEHPAVFPYQLVYDHILSWSDEGDVVLDPFLGSGTTGVASINANRDFVGIEIDKEYFDLAKRRIEQAKNFPGTVYKKPIESTKKKLF
jgi:site-specific DNA-methyltransferase (adenine-specific)